MSTLPPLRECKIRCENWWWNRKLQLHLLNERGVVWGTGKNQPFNMRRRGQYLMLQYSEITKIWYFSWGTEGDFNRCPLPETSAKLLLKELS